MKKIDVFDYLYKKVRIIDIDGQKFEGDVVSVSSSIDSISGEDEIDLDSVNIRIMLKKSDIKSIEVLGE